MQNNHKHDITQANNSIQTKHSDKNKHSDHILLQIKDIGRTKTQFTCFLFSIFSYCDLIIIGMFVIHYYISQLFGLDNLNK